MTKEELLDTLNGLLEAVREAVDVSMRLPSNILRKYGIYDRLEEGELALSKFESDLKDAIHEVRDLTV